VHDGDSPISSGQRIVMDLSTATSGQARTTASQDKLFGSVSEVINNGVAGTAADGTAGTVQGALSDWNDVDLYMATIRAPNAPALVEADVVAGQALFTANGCNGCHGTDAWTISRLFYTPNQLNNAATTGLLDTTSYSLGSLPDALNPPAATTGTAFLRGSSTIQCVLRAVGTFPASGTTGIAPAGVTVSERKENMTATAGGSTGFNPPSLIGVGAGAPYFHAGNARTLEEVFDSTFETHYQALGSNFEPTADEIRQITAYLMSIDENTATFSETVSTIDTVLCPESL